MIAESVYALCAMTSGACASVLLLDYRRQRSRVLFWSGASFTGLAISNALAFGDLVVAPDVDLSVIPAASAAVSIGVLLYGLISESD